MSRWSKKRGVNSSAHPWTDPRNAFAQEINYQKGELPQLDDLADRSVLIPVPPVLTAEACERIIEIYSDAAADLGLR